MKELLEAGVHFGHQAKRWNPKMGKYIFTKRMGIHIIDLQKTVKAAEKAYEFIFDYASKGKTILFVGTKKQARKSVEEAAQKCEMPYVTLRWLGGMLTNFPTIRKSIDKLKRLEKILDSEDKGNLIKKEILTLTREKTKLENVFNGIKNMTKLPDALFIVDTSKEEIAVHEAKNLGIPIIGIVDTISDPTTIDYPIPGNDDAIRAISLFANMAADAVIEGKKKLTLKKEGEDTAQEENETKTETVTADTAEAEIEKQVEEQENTENNEPADEIKEPETGKKEEPAASENNE